MKKRSKSVSEPSKSVSERSKNVSEPSKSVGNNTGGIVARGHEYVCDECGKRATWNVQSQFHEYSIDENGDFTETDCWEGGENEFLCDECHQYCPL